ncbi:hypothetical protein G7Y79_00024g054910 [Physcia stellaris]|nr:hypothetical protein G7Y79_00024g054910 [Physcia stellaris]
MTTSTSAVTPESASAATSAPDLLPCSPALCDHIPEGHSMTQDLKTLYSMHLNGDAKALRCSWYVQAKKAQETYHLQAEIEVNYFTSYAASISNLLTAYVTEIGSHATCYTSFRNTSRIVVGRNTKRTDILGTNCLTTSRCTQALSSPDCDTQIGVQTLEEASSHLPACSAYSASNPDLETPRHSEALSHCGRPVPHVRWEPESIWPATAPNALVLSEGGWQMQPQKQLQIWPLTNPHYVILQCGGLTCFQIGHFRSISSSTRLGETVGPRVTFLAAFVSTHFSIFFFDAPVSLGIFSTISCSPHIIGIPYGPSTAKSHRYPTIDAARST